MTKPDSRQPDMFTYDPAAHSDVAPLAEPTATTLVASIEVRPDERLLQPSEAAPVEFARSGTLNEALAYVQQHNLLPEASLNEARSALKLIGRVTGQDPNTLPASPSDLSSVLKAALPARRRVTLKRWRNAKSAIRMLLRACALHAPRVPRRLPPSTAWRILMDAIPDKHRRAALGPFARFCHRHSVLPKDVSEQSIKDYLAWRQSETLGVNPVKVGSAVRQAWNWTVRHNVPGWPNRLLYADKLDSVDAIAIENFPTSFRDDMNAYLTRKSDTSNPLGKSVRTLRPTTINSQRALLLRAASLVAQAIGDVGQVTSLEVLIVPRNVEYVLLHMHRRAGNAWRGQAGNMAALLLLVAREHVNAEAAVLNELTEFKTSIATQIRNLSIGLSERNRSRLAGLDSPQSRRRYFELAGVLFQTADRMLSESPASAAKLHERALALQILNETLLRVGNLAELKLDRDFRFDHRRCVSGIAIPGRHVKNNRPIEAELSTQLRLRIDRHLKLFRPKLAGNHGPWLFPSPSGGHRNRSNLATGLSRLVRRELGIEYNPHIVRHLAATMVTEENPDNMLVAQRLLGHSSIKTSERMYGERRNRGAQLAWQSKVEASQHLRGHRASQNKAASKSAARRKHKVGT